MHPGVGLVVYMAWGLNDLWTTLTVFLLVILGPILPSFIGEHGT